MTSLPDDGGNGIAVAWHTSPRSDAASTLLVLLPGVNIRAVDFSAQGFVAMLQARGEALDLAILEPAIDHYLDGTIASRLLATVAVLRRAHHRRLWLAGVSLGAFGALLAAAERPHTVDGAMLISPFLGNPGLIAEVKRAGGLALWQPGTIAANDGERRVLAWLKSHLEATERRPALHLGYGRSDRFVDGALLLAAELPSRHIHVAEGGHDWPTWIRLWRCILDARPYSEG
jgi:alpha-beta hydrolase superfamily lysophospholipase